MDTWQAFDSFKVSDPRADYVPLDALLTALHFCDLNPPVSQLDALVADIDTDGSGRIEWEEFRTYCAKFDETKANEEEIRAAFMLFDKDGSGYLDVSEFAAVMSSGGDALSDDELRRW